MQPGSNQGATVIQVAKNHGATHTIIQQNGQHLLVGKLGPNTSSVNTDATALVTDSSVGGGQSVQTLFPAQYIETATEQTVYASSGNGGQVGFFTMNRDTPLRRLYSVRPKTEVGQYHEYAPIIYTPVCGGQTYYQTVGGQVITNAGFGGAGGSLVSAVSGGAHAQIVTHQGATYILQSGASLEDETAALSHTAKASPLTVQWLVENYETAEGVSLPRSTLYFHYLQHCHENKLEPMNPASFGKLIRSVFLGLRTRRLGTRGNSKYHYYGIRIKLSSQLNNYVEDSSFAMRHYPNYHRQSMEAVAEWKNLASSTGGVHGKPSLGNAIGSGGGGGGLRHQSYSTSGQQVVGNSFSMDDRNSSSSVGGTGSIGSTRQTTGLGGVVDGVSLQSKHQHAQFLGEASSALPNLDEICRSAGLPIPGLEEVDLSPSKIRTISSATLSEKHQQATTKKGVDGLPVEDLVAFARLYAHSAGNMLDAVVNLDFSAIAGVWKSFWRTEENSETKEEFEKALPKDRLYVLAKSVAVHQFIRLYDHTFYQSLAEVLIPNVLRPIPPTLTQAIRNFAKHLELWMREALQELDPLLLRIKLSAVSALAQTLRRYTSLNHLAQAARAVLKNASQINQMLIDLSRVDFNNVQEQASWVCQCSDATVGHLEQDFKYILQKQSSLEEWAQWLDTVVTGILRPLEGNNLAYTRGAHQLVLKWSFYSSMVIRDLTLRSAASFGSFHLIRLLYDEYIFYLVEQKVAAHLGMTPVAVMGEMGRSITRPQHLSRSNTDSNRRRDVMTSSTGRLEDALTSKGNSSDPITASRATTLVAEQINSTDVVTNDKVVGLEKEEEESADVKGEETEIENDDNVDDEMVEEAVCDAFESNIFTTGITESAVVAVDEEEEEVDEYLDDEDEPDDSMGDENVMLRRAHESAQQALCREKAAKPNLETSNESVTVPLASPLPASVSECNGANQQSPPAVPTESLEGCDSPPPILTHPIPTRKVVRVTTFDEAQQAIRGGSALQPPSVPTPTLESVVSSKAVSLLISSSSPATQPLIIPSEAKRTKLS